MLDTTLVNAYIMYVESTAGHCLSHMDFRLEVAQALINEQSTVCSVSAAPQDVPLRLTGRHFPVPSIKRDSKICSRRKSGKRKQSSIKCDVCDIHLCIHPCFKKYHTLKSYCKIVSNT